LARGGETGLEVRELPRPGAPELLEGDDLGKECMRRVRIATKELFKGPSGGNRVLLLGRLLPQGGHPRSRFRLFLLDPSLLVAIGLERLLQGSPLSLQLPKLLRAGLPLGL